MATEILLPKMGNSVESCIIVAWRVSEGDSVAAGDPILEVETDKATMEVESTAEGVLLARLVKEGDDVPVLTPVAVVGSPGEKIRSGPPEAKPAPTAASPTPPRTAEAGGAGGSAGELGGGRTTGEPAGSRTLRRIAISPRARKLAASTGVDYSAIAGSGPGGRIMVRDIEHAAAEPAVPPGSADADGRPGSGGRFREVPVERVRRIIAHRMRESLATTAQLTMHSSADARRLLDLRKRFKAADPDDLKAVSINDVILFAVSRTLRRFPEMNATHSDGVVRMYEAVDLGFAVDTSRGLTVPVIRNADTLSLVQLTAEAHRLAEACKSSRVTPDELQGGTFTVTNLGALGVERFTPVLNAPQVGILGVGNSQLRPVMVDGVVEFVPMLGLSLTIDHQIVDGAPGAKFLQEVARAIEEIDLTLAQ